MRRLLLALPFALLPLAVAHAHEDDHGHEHGSLGAHEHSVARINAALDGQTLELELESPAMNLVGFEHAASSPADKAKVAKARKLLEQPVALFNLPKAANCTVASQKLESPLFGDKPAADHDDDHSEIHAHYQFSCSTPAALKSLDLAQLFKAFPATQKIQVQLIGPNGQKGVDATPAAATLNF
ncbi:DUF2796 domain-containing protein [Pseudomonas sp. R5(2019)]|uniref:DUF2796 domain-containing protein n=1 Tax=Pseudomonas sp. R5(2019) TaxID=2697566 RepID=UPI0014122ED3|nr:DUF2796 domain-containing protein [Pseudomonas sp. R5(2019)]NBA96110.1 DUF2796 domain-containing protein [Pseudomonas sp. R5(2019)]